MEDVQDLTKRQRQVLEFLRDWGRLNPYPPTVREIGDGLGMSSPSTVQAHLNSLEAKGYIKRDASKSRSIELMTTQDEVGSNLVFTEDELMRQVIALPVVGRVAAGTPILAEQNVEEVLPLPIGIVGDIASFMLRVQGESMVDAGIFDGDYVVVREQQSADNGDIVVAMIDDGATVKTFYREADRIRLQPQNHTMEPIYTRDAKILGVVTALFRSL